MIYLATPYSFNPRLGFLIAAKSAIHFHRQGKKIYSPILHWHSCAEVAGLPHDAGTWWEHNCHMLTISTTLWVIQHEETPRSTGVQREINWWNNKRKRAIKYVPWEEIDGHDH